MRFIATKTQDWLNRWDEFVFNSPKGNHLVYSDWLQSYQSYGFDFEIGLVLDDNDIILAGYGAVIPKALIFKFYIIPIGPIVDECSDIILKTLFNHLENRARALKCTAAQISIPYSNHQNIKAYTYQPELFAAYLMNFEQSKCFDYVYAAYGVNWIDLTNFKSSDDYLDSLTPKVRRNIRIPYNKGLNCSEAFTLNDIKLAYDVIEENAQQAGYKVRSFKSLQNTLLNLVTNQKAKMLLIKDIDDIKAAGFFILTKKGYTNIMGGAKRTKPDLKLGYMLQYEIIKDSFKISKPGYDISMGGSIGVQEFKARFSAHNIPFDNSHFSLVISSFKYKLFKLFNSKIKPLKTRISQFLQIFK
jgi:lipid II:glycine glycyltransferase (peptidoglycan interpeptide bridge formation enzyme)